MKCKFEYIQSFITIAFLTSCAITDSSLQELHKLEQPGQATSHTYSDQDIERIITDAVPILDTTDESQSGFQIRIRLIQNEALFEIDCAFDGDQKEKCVIFDSHDNVPIFIAANDQVLFYEPIEGLYHSDHAGWTIKIGASDKGIKFSWSIKQKVNEGRISINLRSIIQGFFFVQALEQLDQDRFRYLARTARGSRFEATVNVYSKQFEHLYLKNKEGVAIIILNQSIAGETIPMSAVEFPRIPDHLKTKPISFPNIDETRLLPDAEAIAEYIRFAYRLVSLREAIRRPEKRGKIEEYLGEKFDWVTLTETDKKISAQLRSLIKQ